ncbi:hypothetical protein BDF14DRAFT_1047609 [Spinellus fusiger]|nr:hypothetical protein BDF14DRAFT_1047609 [Spinellus fusiger]
MANNNFAFVNTTSGGFGIPLQTRPHPSPLHNGGYPPHTSQHPRYPPSFASSPQPPPPPPQQQQQQQQQQLQLQSMHGRMAYTPSYAPPNRRPSESTQGLFSTYSSRLKQSDDNALLLPATYLTNKKPRFIHDSDDEFEEMDDSDEKNTSSGMVTRSATVGHAPLPGTAGHASTAGTAAVGHTGPTSITGTTGPTSTIEYKKVIHKKNHIYPSEHEMERASSMEEVLVPIRLDIDLDDIKLRDTFLWNMNGKLPS